MKCLEVSLRRFRQNQLFRREIRHYPTQTLDFFLKLVHLSQLRPLPPPIKLALPIERQLRHAPLVHSRCNCRALSLENFNLTKFRSKIFRLSSFSSHRCSSSLREVPSHLWTTFGGYSSELPASPRSNRRQECHLNFPSAVGAHALGVTVQSPTRPPHSSATANASGVLDPDAGTPPMTETEHATEGNMELLTFAFNATTPTRSYRYLAVWPFASGLRYRLLATDASQYHADPGTPLLLRRAILGTVELVLAAVAKDLPRLQMGALCVVEGRQKRPGIAIGHPVGKADLAPDHLGHFGIALAPMAVLCGLAQDAFKRLQFEPSVVFQMMRLKDELIGDRLGLVCQFA